jgi:hypothetical protein
MDIIISVLLQVVNWQTAKANAIALGGHLVTITSQAEEDFIAANNNSEAWIGLTDEVTEGYFLMGNRRTIRL